MARTPKRRPVASPGPTRTRTRRTTAVARSAVEPRAAAAGGGNAWLRVPGGLGITSRAIVLLVVLAVLAISFAHSVRIYLDQDAEIAGLRQEAAQREASIGQLNADLARWEDEDYVRAQARERLGWVVPGEIGFRVIGPDGQALGTSIDSARRTPVSDQPEVVPWWGQAWGSIQAADHPAPPPGDEPDPADAPPITPDGG